LCAEDGRSVTVIEAGAIAHRTTGHSTAKLTALHGLTYAKLSRGRGAEAAAVYAAGNMAALARLRELIADLDIDCEFTEPEAFTCAATNAGIASIEREAEAAMRAGLPVDVTSATELDTLVRRAVRLPAQSHFDPYAFCRGLVEACEFVVSRSSRTAE
jgi:glycine/D-amino acid oxidase-like deaminating enzyme